MQLVRESAQSAESARQKFVLADRHQKKSYETIETVEIVGVKVSQVSQLSHVKKITQDKKHQFLRKISRK